MEALVGVWGNDPDLLWQDREIRFDVSGAQLACRQGEETLAVLEPVEDTKGNNGTKGRLVATPLRLMWTSASSRRVNISIGLGCITAVTTIAVSSRLKGQARALKVMTKHNQQRFEFIFTSLTEEADAGDLQAMAQQLWQAYEASRLYRDLKLRGAVIQDKELVQLPMEQVYSRVAGVWNLTSEQGNLGTFIISNVRVVWFSNLADAFNASIPYLQIKAISARDTQFGHALVIKTTPASGGYVLGFKIDPPETLAYVLKELTSLRAACLARPQFGVQADVQAARRQAAALARLALAEEEEDVLVVDAADDKGDVLAAYCTGPLQGQDREPVFCAELGLAVEALRPGTTIDELWRVV